MGDDAMAEEVYYTVRRRTLEDIYQRMLKIKDPHVRRYDFNQLNMAHEVLKNCQNEAQVVMELLDTFLHRVLPK